MNIAAMWLGLPKWVRDAIMIFGAVLAVIFLGKAYVKGKQNEAVAANNAKRDKEAAEAEAQVISNIQETTDAVIHEADTVREHNSASVLPDGSAALEKYHYRD